MMNVLDLLLFTSSPLDLFVNEITTTIPKFIEWAKVGLLYLTLASIIAFFLKSLFR